MPEVEKVKQAEPVKEPDFVMVYCGDPESGGSPYVVRDKKNVATTVYYQTVDAKKIPKGWDRDPMKVK